MGKSISAMGGRLIALDGFSAVRPMECDAVINVTREAGGRYVDSASSIFRLTSSVISTSSS
jgi:hypothetical protein